MTPAGRPAILERAALLAPSNGLRIVKAHTTRPNQQTITATDASLPPRAGETLYTFTGAKVPAQPTGTKDPIAHGIGLVLNRPASAEPPGQCQDPHLQREGGGSCSQSGLACSSVFARKYVMPGTITNALVQGARVWSSIQFYHLVNGSRQKGNLTWDCTNSNPAYHRTSRGEFYCESDLTRAVSNALSLLAAGSFLFVDPASGATIAGRGKPTGAM